MTELQQVFSASFYTYIHFNLRLQNLPIHLIWEKISPTLLAEVNHLFPHSLGRYVPSWIVRKIDKDCLCILLYCLPQVIYLNTKFNMVFNFLGANEAEQQRQMPLSHRGKDSAMENDELIAQSQSASLLQDNSRACAQNLVESVTSLKLQGTVRFFDGRLAQKHIFCEALLALLRILVMTFSQDI